MANEESKIISFPQPENNENVVELSPEQQAIIDKAEEVDAAQTDFISEVVTNACRLVDEESAKLNKVLPYHIPIEVGIGVSATYLNMFNDESGTPVESLIDDIQGLTAALSSATEKYFTDNPEVSPTVYFYALLHSFSSSLRQQRFMMNVEQAEAEYHDAQTTESNNESKGE